MTRPKLTLKRPAAPTAKPQPEPELKPGIARKRARAYLARHRAIREKLPLAIGTGKILVAAAPPGLKRQVRDQLTSHVHSVAYLTAASAEGAMRYNLDGEPASPVSDQHRAYAADMLQRAIKSHATS